MYAAVPCYNLSALHEAIKHDLPPTPDGLRAVWRVIAGAVARQRDDPDYVQPITLPQKGKGQAREREQEQASAKSKST